MFFLAWKRKWAWKPILDLFLDFFTCKVSVSRPLFLTFFTFFTPDLSFSRALIGFFWYFFTGTKKKFTGILLRIFTRWNYVFTCTIWAQCFFFGVKTKVGMKTDFGPFFAFFHVQTESFTPIFHAHFCVFTGLFLDFFHVHSFSFHVCLLGIFFTCKTEFSRALFDAILDFFTCTFFFSRAKS